MKKETSVRIKFNMYFEPFLIDHSSLVALIATIVAIILAALGTWTGVTGWIDGMQGMVTGKIIAEDGDSPAIAKLVFRTKNRIQISPDENGFFSATMPRGRYQLEIQANKYSSVTLPERMLYGRSTDQLNEIILRVEPKPIKISLKDKKGNPYKNISFSLYKTAPEAGTQYPLFTNSEGIVITDPIIYGHYRLDIGPHTTPQNSFLWVASENSYVGRLELKATKDSYELVLPRIIFSEVSGANSAIAILPKSERYFAQKFQLESSISYCGIGLGLGLGKSDSIYFNFLRSINPRAS